MSSREPHLDQDLAAQIGGFVLAGGRSSRMGTDKAMLLLAGRPLIAHALAKLSAIAAAPAILAGMAPGNSALSGFARLVFDLHPGCGPVGGIEAALTASTHPWNLILPVDVPFLPRGLLAWWVERTLVADSPVRIALLRANGQVQPGVLLIHRRVLPFISQAIEEGEYKLLRVFESAARSLSSNLPRESAELPPALQITELPSVATADPSPGRSELLDRLRPAECATECLWFANLNSPQDLTQAGQLVARFPDLL